MMNVKMLLQYDGSAFDGWQKQKNTERTIQGKLEAVLSSLAGVPVVVHGAGRTDAGVHALGQVAHCHLPTEQDPLFLRDYLNRYLPERIAVLQVEKVPEQFHSRLSAKGKEYCYHIRRADATPDVFRRGFYYSSPKPVDVVRMRKALLHLVGTHDFASFCTHPGKKKSTVRSLWEIVVQEEGPEMVLRFRGDGFLHNMVRILTGTLLEVGWGERDPDSLVTVLQEKDRAAAGFTAPPQGLFLSQVFY